MEISEPDAGMSDIHQGKMASRGKIPKQANTPTTFRGNQSPCMQQYQHHSAPGSYVPVPSPSMATQSCSSTTTFYPPPLYPSGSNMVFSQQHHKPVDTASMLHPSMSVGYQNVPPECNPSAKVEPFGLAFNVFEENRLDEPVSSPRELEQLKLLEVLALKQGQLVRKEEEIGNMKVQLEKAKSNMNKVYSEKLGEVQLQFKQSIRVLEDMLETKNQEVEGLLGELQYFHRQMEVIQVEQYINNKDYYRLDRNPHGICVIINNHMFHHPTDPDQAHNNRGGAEVDQKNLHLTFQYLRYKVEIYENLTHTMMMEVMLSLAQRNHTDYDSFICCILTRGEQNSVYGADSIPVSLLDLTGVMKMCTTLINKPKMFFIQACRGDHEDEGHKVDTNDSEVNKRHKLYTEEVVKGHDSHELYTEEVAKRHELYTEEVIKRHKLFSEKIIQGDCGGRQPPSTHTIPQEADFFFGYATPLGNAAYRSRRHGSWYISELCRVLTKHAYTSNLSNMMRKVNDNICRAFTKEGYKQTSEFVDRLRKEVHFFHFSKVGV